MVKGKGNVINDNNKGDIKVFVKIQNDSKFQREGLDLILNKKINLKEALLGFKFDINFINGNLNAWLWEFSLHRGSFQKTDIGHNSRVTVQP